MSKKYFEDTSLILKKQIGNQLQHYEKLNKTREEYYSFRHDYINHMRCISSLIQSGKKDDAIDYINKLSSNNTLFIKLYESGNSILDSILTEKSEIALSHHTKIELDGVFTENFDPIDLCIIFSNALDNAIEACCKIDGEKTIHVRLNIQQGYQFIFIDNPIVSTFDTSNINLKTTKLDKTRHGFGLNNIKNSVKTHNGKLEMKQRDGQFALEITLKLN